MMRVLTLSLIKAHCRLDENDEDELLALYGDAAEQFVWSYIDRDYVQVLDYWGEIPAPLVQGMLMIVANSYANRTPISPANLYMVPYTFDALVRPYMRLSR